MPLKKCDLCGNKDTKIYIKSKADFYPAHNGNDEFYCTSLGLSNPGEIRMCTNCGYIFTIPHYTEVKVIKKYSQVEDILHLKEKAARIKTYQSSLQLVEKYRLTPGKLLDIGSYVGFFLEVVRSKGWDVFGLEPCKWAYQYATNEVGLKNVINQSLTSTSYAGQKFDVVTMWDVIEHLYYPTQKLILVNRLLKDDGLLVFSTHDMQSTAARLLGRKYPFLMSMHVSHFTRDSLNFLLLKAGFKLLDVEIHTRYISLGYLINRLNRYIPILAKTLAVSIPAEYRQNKLVPIRFMGLINVVAKKTNSV